jgi:predicted RNA methylase
MSDGILWSNTDYPYMCLMDTVRTLAFKEAIEASVKPNDVVVDVGSGTGILALIAARAGAGRVCAVEFDHTLAEALRQTVRANDLADVIEVLEGDAATVPLPSEADVVVAELIETGLIDEMQVPVLNALVERGTIGKNTIVIPEAYTTYAEPVYSDDSYYDFRIAAPKHQWPFYGTTDGGWCPVDLRVLANRQEVVTVRFGQLNDQVVSRTMHFTLSAMRPVTGVKLSGIVHLRAGQTMGATNAVNGDKVFVIEPLAHEGRIGLFIHYEMGAGLKTLRLECRSRVLVGR